MDYPTDIGMWNDGRMDAWNTARAPGYGMGYFERSDLPYYYALADAFTVGDHHFQSTFTQVSEYLHRHLLLLHRLLPLPKGLLLCIDVPDVLE